MALGANRDRVVRMVLRGAFLQAGIGFAIGIRQPLAPQAGFQSGIRGYSVGSADAFCGDSAAGDCGSERGYYSSPPRNGFSPKSLQRGFRQSL